MCESEIDALTDPKDVLHSTETTDVPQLEKTSLLFPHSGGATPTNATPTSTQTTVPSSIAVSKSERETLQVPHSEKATKFPLRKDGIKLLFQELKVQNVFFPYSSNEGKYHRGM